MWSLVLAGKRYITAGHPIFNRVIDFQPRNFVFGNHSYSGDRVRTDRNMVGNHFIWPKMALNHYIWPKTDGISRISGPSGP